MINCIEYVTFKTCSRIFKSYKNVYTCRPLPEELCRYAQKDTHYLLYIYDCLKNELIERGNDQTNLLLSVLQRSTQLCLKVSEDPATAPHGHCVVPHSKPQLYIERWHVKPYMDIWGQSLFLNIHFSLFIPIET